MRATGAGAELFVDGEHGAGAARLGAGVERRAVQIAGLVHDQAAGGRSRPVGSAEAVEHRFGAVGRKLENRTAAAPVIATFFPAVKRRSIEVAGLVPYHAAKGVGTVGNILEAMEHVQGAVRGKFENVTENAAAPTGSAVQIAGLVADEAGKRTGTVAVIEGVKHGLLAV